MIHGPRFSSFWNSLRHQRRDRRLATIFALLAMGFVAPAANAQPSTRCEDRQRVRGIDFAGSPKFDDATLSASIATPTPGFWARILHLKAFPCSDSLQIQLDALRLAVMHRQQGWLETAVVPTLTRAPNGVHIRFDITPGTASILDTVVISGLPPNPDGAPFDRPLLALQGHRFDRVHIDTTITSVMTQLRNAGFARATRPVMTVRIDSASMGASISLAFTPGNPATIGEVRVDVQGVADKPATIDAGDVRGLVSLHSNTPFRASDILRAQRALYRSDVFSLVLIDTVTPATGADSIIDLRIRVAEGRSRNARMGVGWATLECIRTQARMIDRRFLGVGKRLELNARASRIGVGAPADFAPNLCSPALRADTQFTVLNHYIGATMSSGRLLGAPLSPIFSVYTERRSEPYAYMREIGIGTLFELSGEYTPRTTGTIGLQYENGRTKIDPAEACSRFGQCRQEEYDQSVFGRGVGIFSTSVSNDHTSNAIDPTQGIRSRGEFRAGQTFTKGDTSLRFYRVSGDASTYLRALGGVVAFRVQGARAFAPGAPLVDGSPLIPQQERLFAGGQNTVRGFQQNLLGPLVYVVSNVRDTTVGGIPIVVTNDNADYDRAVPRGGTALLVGNIEYRRGFRWLAEQLQVAAFADVGNVWEAGASALRLGDLRVTPGVGLRVFTALGPFRVDIGYQPYEPRAGRALYLAKGTNGTAGTIQCASPGNTVSIDPTDPGSIFDCPETYRPPSARGTLSRLVFHFGLGQAF